MNGWNSAGVIPQKVQVNPFSLLKMTPRPIADWSHRRESTCVGNKYTPVHPRVKAHKTRGKDHANAYEPLQLQPPNK